MKEFVIKIIALIFITSVHSFGSDIIFWADEVYDVSSEYHWEKYPFAYKAKQLLGKPNVMPGKNNDTKLCWSPAEDNGGTEFIEVGFSQNIRPSQIIIVENMHPGAVKDIQFIDNSGRMLFRLSERNGFKNDDLTKPLILAFPQTDNFVKRVRITLNTALVQGYNAIDAVGLSETAFPYEVSINLVSDSDNMNSRERLPATVNSPTDELLPQITPDGKSLYFTRENHSGNFGFKNGKASQDIWLSEIDEDKNFTIARRLNKPINNEYNNSLCAITPDGQKALLMNVYNKDGSMNKGISFSIMEADGWGFPTEILIEDYYNNSIYGEYHLSVSGKILIMAVERDDSYGLKDVYVSFLQTNGNWSAPLNLGPIVNTEDSEVSPFLAADEKSLYYASPGLVGYGSHDIYITRRLDDSWTNWSEPQNLGPSVNTAEFDAYYSIPASGEYAYFSSANENNGQDIYRIKLQQEAKPTPVVLVKGNVYDANTNKPIAADVRYESLTSGAEIGEARSRSSDGFYSIVLPAGDKYGFRAEANGYAAVSQNIDLSALEYYDEIKRDLFLVPLEAGQTIRLNNVFFEYDKTEILLDALPELKRLTKLMNDYPGMTVEIAGHTDNVGSESYNRRLSRDRAKAVYDYLVSSGITSSRMSFKGYGESKPIESNDNDSGRAVNRRVEFKIIKL